MIFSAVIFCILIKRAEVTDMEREMKDLAALAPETQDLRLRLRKEEELNAGNHKILLENERMRNHLRDMSKNCALLEAIRKDYKAKYEAKIDRLEKSNMELKKDAYRLGSKLNRKLESDQKSLEVQLL